MQPVRASRYHRLTMNGIDDLIKAMGQEHEALRVKSMSLRDTAVTLENLLISYSTGGSEREEDYMALRDRLMADPGAKPRLPDFIRTCRNLAQLWIHMKKWPTYAERRDV